ncbi:hypothetical protein SAMN00790413_03096 [Deinococcus hopiensis KR-140]|uniref:Uncharacterized protein n=1 Tax=Deinococcus hopiensis KR-140 TaxID=695939 RepID=A0A1W1VS96_9DEIO|nr:hypothetical protein SAMN00790413_03096 [Deinococcus hopiensis KR-140]
MNENGAVRGALPLTAEFGQMLWASGPASEGFNRWTANGEVAGQDALYPHLHAFLRRNDDRLKMQVDKPAPKRAG